MRLSKGRRVIEVCFVPQTVIRLIDSDASLVCLALQQRYVCANSTSQGLLTAIGEAQRLEEEPDNVVLLQRDVGFSFDSEHQPMNEQG